MYLNSGMLGCLFISLYISSVLFGSSRLHHDLIWLHRLVSTIFTSIYSSFHFSVNTLMQSLLQILHRSHLIPCSLEYCQILIINSGMLIVWKCSYVDLAPQHSIKNQPPPFFLIKKDHSTEWKKTFWPRVFREMKDEKNTWFLFT